MTVRILLLASLVTASACSEGPAPVEPAGVPRVEPVVLYADTPGEAALQAVFEQLTADTGIRVTVRQAPAAKNLEDVMNNTGAPPADILLTASIADIWRAGDDGALRRLGDDAGIGSVPVPFRDPDGLWFALAADPVVIVYASAGDAARELDYADLAAEEFEGQLCLSSSTNAENRALIAHLIADIDVRPAERIVRRWMQNLALPPHGSAAGLLAAVRAGTCRFAFARQSDVLAAVPPPAFRVPPGDSAVIVAAYGIGLARHARYAESAARVLNWLAGSRGQELFALASRARGVTAPPPEWSTRPLAELGWLDEDARLLAERARWR